MDRSTTRMDADARTMRIDLPDADAFLPPSRRAVLDLCLDALGSGPILLTGDVGIGKTWTVRQLTRRVIDARWLTVDLTPNDGPSEFYRHLARGLGLASAGPVGPTRLDINEALAERTADGERFGLVIDEAHNLTADVWEEVRVLINRLGAEDGFAHLALVGQTSLIRRFATRALAAIEARLAAHVHLRPIDVAEAFDWLARRHPGLDWSADEVEAVHRDAGGNPSRLLRRSLAVSARLKPKVAIAPPRPSPTSTIDPGSTKPAGDSPLDGYAPKAMMPHRASSSPPLTGAARPPLHVEDNSIEVGWSADDPEPGEYDEDAAGADGDDFDPTLQVTMVPRVEDSEQAVHDHYAALQAWREWASNQERRVPSARSDRDLADEIDEAAAAEAAELADAAAPDRASLRAEGYQHFAPFGQLFNRMAPVRES